MAFCLPPEAASAIRDAMQSGTFDINKFKDMSTEAREDALKDIVGDEAKEVNLAFEKKLLLKNTTRGIQNWIDSMTGADAARKEEMQQKLTDEAARKDNRLMNPEGTQQFLAELAADKFGRKYKTEMTHDEVKQVVEMTNTVREAKTKWNSSKWEEDAKTKRNDPNNGWESEDARMEYGAHYVGLQNYVKSLKTPDSSFLDRLKERSAESGKVIGTARSLGDFVSTVSGIAKGVKASFDDSFLGRQGFKAMVSHPITWAKNAGGSFEMIGKQLFRDPSDERILDAVKADIYSRANAMRGLYDKAKLDIGNTEETFPVSSVEKIPVLGNAFKASEVAFEGTAYRLRADLFDQYEHFAAKGGVDLADEKQVRSIGKMVNSLTGRGDLGDLEKVGKTINNIFFSPKFLKSNFDFLTAHLFDDTSTFAKKQAAINLGRAVVATGAILLIAKAVNPDSVELDPHSADFGKIKIGDTRFDVTGGMGSIAVLGARVIPAIASLADPDLKKYAYIKSTTSGRKNMLNTGKFGASTALDVVNDFFDNRAAPGLALLLDGLRGTDAGGNPVTPAGEVQNMIEPFVAQNVQDSLADPGSANVLLTELLDGLGFAENTYPDKKKKS